MSLKHETRACSVCLKKPVPVSTLKERQYTCCSDCLTHRTEECFEDLGTEELHFDEKETEEIRTMLKGTDALITRLQEKYSYTDISRHSHDTREVLPVDLHFLERKPTHPFRKMDYGISSSGLCQQVLDTVNGGSAQSLDLEFELIRTMIRKSTEAANDERDSLQGTHRLPVEPSEYPQV
jgi:hypothetical protein